MGIFRHICIKPQFLPFSLSQLWITFGLSVLSFKHSLPILVLTYQYAKLRSLTVRSYELGCNCHVSFSRQIFFSRIPLVYTYIVTNCIITTVVQQKQRCIIILLVLLCPSIILILVMREKLNFCILHTQITTDPKFMQLRIIYIIRRHVY